jgi:hypothetical protein
MQRKILIMTISCCGDCIYSRFSVGKRNEWHCDRTGQSYTDSMFKDDNFPERCPLYNDESEEVKHVIEQQTENYLVKNEKHNS